MVKVLDTSALLCYLEKENHYEIVAQLLSEAAQSGDFLQMTTVQWGELFYVLSRNYNLELAEKSSQLIETLPIDFIPVDQTLSKQAALYKTVQKLPYVDCFAAALTKLKEGELITKDYDFKVLESEIKINWL